MDTIDDDITLSFVDTEKKEKALSLQDRIAEIAKRNAAKVKSQEEAKTTEIQTQQGREEEAPEIIPARASMSAMDEVQLNLFKSEDAGQFTSYPITPSTEHPTFLTRIPIFVPARRSNQRELLDEDNSISFVTSWGKGKKYGPPLTVYDEDTLMAIGRLRSKGLAGQPANLPVPVSEIYREKAGDNINVHIVCCMLSDIQAECGTAQGGKNNKLRLSSIRRLAATTIELDTKTAEKIVGRGINIKLIDVAWQEFTDNAILYIQFSPIMAKWYEREYTYINWSIRQKLHDTGKAIHRFLAGQPKVYEIHTAKIMKTINYMRPNKRFTDDLRTTMKILQEEGWILEWEISGTGRKTPHKLHIIRA